MIPGSFQTPSPIIPQGGSDLTPRMESAKNRPHGIGLIRTYSFFYFLTKLMLSLLLGGVPDLLEINENCFEKYGGFIAFEGTPQAGPKCIMPEIRTFLIADQTVIDRIQCL